jgi:hypothetical protein
VTAPAAPSGSIDVPLRPYDRQRGIVARWRHGDQLPAVEVELFAPVDNQPARVRVSIVPYPILLDGVTDPAELRRVAWCALRAARWLEREADPRRPAAPDPQTTIYDHLETA